MRIASLRTTSGQTLSLESLTVLVGPNNVGKSQTLRDIHSIIATPNEAKKVVVEELECPDLGDAEELLSRFKVMPDPGNTSQEIALGISSNLVSGHRLAFIRRDIEANFAARRAWRNWFPMFGRFMVAHLDAASRLQVVKECESYNPHRDNPSSILQVLYAEKSQETTFQKAFKDAFEMEVRLDLSGLRNLSLRVAKRFGAVPEDPRDALPVMAKFQQMDEQGDGYKSFAGVVLSVLLARGRIVLLDEPEAFLHPAQARALGAWLASHVTGQNMQVVVATHNAHFIAGILSVSQPVSLLRLSRAADRTTYTALDPDAIKKLSSDPVLSSQRILEAVFHRGVAVCEADADRALYQTVCSRFVKNHDVLFVHAHNKQTIPPVLRLLRGASVPCAAVPDFDVFRVAQDIENCIEALGVPYASVPDIEAARAELEKQIGERPDADVLKEVQASVDEFKAQLDAGRHSLDGARSRLRDIEKQGTKWAEAKSKGLDGVPAAARDQVRKAVDGLQAHGLFVVPGGQLESWMNVGVSGARKKEWIVKALEELANGRCPVPLSTFVSSIVGYLTK